MNKVKGNKRGKRSDEILLEVIEKHPSLSQYELSRKLRWSSGRVDGSVRRLLKSNKIFLRVIERNGRRVNLVYPKEQKPAKIIEVPSELLEGGNPVWRDEAFFYALDSSTIGISGRDIEEWRDISCFAETVHLRRESARAHREGRTLLPIPENFWRFYNLDRKHRVVSINGNNLLVTVSGDIIEDRNYPS